jgi:putative Mg2+ transporter-C (MgtC) family protein
LKKKKLSKLKVMYIDNFVSPEILEMMFQITLAGILGMLIGAEREHKGKAAGLRTYMLVALGAAVFTIMSAQAHLGGVVDPNAVTFDPTRIAAQVVVGIGFIGAGMIILRQDKVRGLTTAAGLWVTSAIGMSVGFGFYAVAIYTTLLVVLVLWALTSLERQIHEVANIRK